ncbi:MAG: hypothetical protein Q9179_002487 [Wetmoreana sp. 5 TL-2023]
MINGFLSQAVPPTNVSEAIIDHDYTLLALKRYSEAARELWKSTILGMMKMEGNVAEPVRRFIQNDLRAFKESRRMYEQTQKTFDGLLYRYAAQSKSKEPSSLREDAFQVHEARKAYLKASMDLSIMAPQLRMKLDKVLVKVSSDQWRDMRYANGNIKGSVRKWDREIERVRSWSREIENGEGAFRKELLNARKQMEDTTEAHLRPSRELEDYANLGSPTGVKVLATADASHTPARAEKQGWLYLRTLSGKPTRTVWVRRWFFVKNGIFGWLVQGLRSGGVEESDRIGVLLCNVRPAQCEERRFTFEVKTKDLSIVLQADSQVELVEWMKAFQSAKQKALEDPASTDSPGLEGPSQDPAFSISSPPAPEFAASAADSGMNQFREDSSTTSLERGSALPLPGADNGFGLPSRSSTDYGGHRRSTAGDREGESGRDHAARIIQKLDLHRKSIGGPQLASNAGGPPPSPALAGGGIASLIAASHNVMPVGPGILPQSPLADMSAVHADRASGPYSVPSSSLAPNTLANAPAPTNLSATAVLVNGERGIGVGRADATPSGVMANIWGSSNWGYLNRLERGEVQVSHDLPAPPSASLQSRPTPSPPKTPQLPAGSTEGANIRARSATSASPHRKTASLPSGTTSVHDVEARALGYPNYYPLQLKTQDAQFRLLFPNVSRTERVVLVFRATWSLNEQQEFPGRVYVTPKQIYFYSHHLGLVLTSGIGFDSILEVTAASGRDYDLLVIHLRANSDNTIAPRVTVKSFLEPLKLLQQRLEYLIESCKSGQPPEVETVIKNLIKLEQSDSDSRPNKDEYEDFNATATSDEGRAGRSDIYSANRGLRAAVMFDGEMHGSMHRSDEARISSKIKLPRQPVVYVPSGMNQAVIDQVFEISPKALFHVMFGDKSALWQLLYHERQAQRIKQGSWTRGEQSPPRRDFEYLIEYRDILGRVRTETVVDYQMIDVSNDHLCYVVTDRKTPWHLPCGHNFSMLNKIVITHHAKSKCRLAVYTKVDWTRGAGVFHGVITRQAYKDLRSDALDLADLITDQVRRLGAQSRTKKAIQIFGQVGLQTQASAFSGSDAPIKTRVRRSIKRRTMTRLLVDAVTSSVQDLLSSVTQWILALGRWVWKTLDANAVILAILATSIVTNLIFSSSGTTQWWRDRQAANHLARIGVGFGNVMSKAIYLQDLTDVWVPEIGRDAFDTYLSSTDMSAPETSAGAFSTHSASRPLVARLQRSRQRLGSQRHSLIVALRVVNSIEREMVEAEWEGWLHDESAKCKQIERLLRQNSTAPSNADSQSSPGKHQSLGAELRDWTKARSWHERYCGSCYSEKESLEGMTLAKPVV